MPHSVGLPCICLLMMVLIASVLQNLKFSMLHHRHLPAVIANAANAGHRTYIKCTSSDMRVSTAARNLIR
jgi:hypothetical protein